MLRHVCYRGPADEGLSTYELERLANIRRNQMVLKSLGLDESMRDEAPQRRQYRKRTRPSAPSRQSLRVRQTPPVPTDPVLHSETRRHRRAHRRGALPPTADDGSFVGCSPRARLRHQLSTVQRYANIDEALKRVVLASNGGGLPRDTRGNYVGVARIESGSGWHYRATFGKGDYGTFCEPEMAAFVSLYGKNFELPREVVWHRIGIRDLSSTEGAADAAAPPPSGVDDWVCAGCQRVIAQNDEPTELAFGCTHSSGCDVWMCWRCAGFESEDDGLRHVDDDWVCPRHR